jgi:hypothetical protein
LKVFIWLNYIDKLLAKLKAKIVLVPDHHPMKTYQGMVVKLHHAFLTSVLDGGEWSTSSFRPLIHKERIG